VIICNKCFVNPIITNFNILLLYVPVLHILLHIKTRGPRGPWVAHLRKRSKVTVDSIIENPRGII